MRAFGFSVSFAVRRRTADALPAAVELGIFAVTTDMGHFGSSTEAGASGTDAPSKHLANSLTTGGTYWPATSGAPPGVGGVIIYNGGSGGQNSTGVAAIVNAASARVKAAPTVLQLAGHYEAGVINPENTIAANAAVILGYLGHANVLFCNKHNDENAHSGSFDNTRIKATNRKLAGLYPGKVWDMGLTFRFYATLDPTDIANQVIDEVPASLQIDAAHCNNLGNIELGKVRRRFAAALQGILPLVCDQKLAQNTGAGARITNGALVLDVPHHPSSAGGLADCTVSLVPADPDFSVAIEGGALKVRRASVNPLIYGYYDLPIRVEKGGLYAVSRIRGYPIDTANPTPRKVRCGAADYLVKEGPLALVTNASRVFTGFIFMRKLTQDGAVTKGMVNLGNTAGLRLNLKTTNVSEFLIRNAGNTTNIVNLDGNQQILTSNANVRCMAFKARTTAGSKVQQSRVDKLALQSNAALLAADDEALMICPTGATTLHTLLQAQAAQNTEDYSGTGYSKDFVAMWLAEGDLDISSDIVIDGVRDSVTGMPRFHEYGGVINGVAPFLWMQGPAANVQAGANLADLNDPWFATDRARMFEVA